MNTQLAILAHAIATALNAFADSIQLNEPAGKFPKVEDVVNTATVQGVLPAPSNVGVSTSTLTNSTPNLTLSVVEALKQGLTLTGNELDENGLPWLKDINTNKPAVSPKNIWKKGKGVDAVVYAQTIADWKAKFASEVAPAGLPAPAPAGLPAPAPAPAGRPAPAPTGLPAPAPAGLPMPAPVDEHAAIKKQILAEVNNLTNTLEVDYEVIQEFFADDFNASDRTFATVLPADYPAVYKALVGWSECLKLIANVTVDCLSLNGGDRGVIIEHIYTNGSFGCTDATLVHKSETWRLYEALSGYRTMLENHFQKPLTAPATNPYL